MTSVDPLHPNDHDHEHDEGHDHAADQTERFAAMLAEVFGEDDPLASGDCSAMLERLYLFLDGELTEERRALIMEHLDSCNTCLGAFDFEAELRLVVRERINTRVPESLVSRLRQSIESALGDPGPDAGDVSSATSPEVRRTTE